MSEDLLHHMADVACVRAWKEEGWGPYHMRLLTMCVANEFPGRKRKTTEMTSKLKVLTHLKKTGTISIREAMDDYSISGGHLTKIISRLRLDDGMKITRKMLAHPMTNARYARYYMAATR